MSRHSPNSHSQRYHSYGDRHNSSHESHRRRHSPDYHNSDNYRTKSSQRFDENRDDFWTERRLKREEIGESGYFSVWSHSPQRHEDSDDDSDDSQTNGRQMCESDSVSSDNLHEKKVKKNKKHKKSEKKSKRHKDVKKHKHRDKKSKEKKEKTSKR